eukprot:4904144-Prymnesium_polylepis.1
MRELLFSIADSIVTPPPPTIDLAPRDDAARAAQWLACNGGSGVVFTPLRWDECLQILADARA